MRFPVPGWGVEQKCGADLEGNGEFWLDGLPS